jgi:hypothetical protein
MVGKKLPEVAWEDCSGELQIGSLRGKNIQCCKYLTVGKGIEGFFAVSTQGCTVSHRNCKTGEANTDHVNSS